MPTCLSSLIERPAIAERHERGTVAPSRSCADSRRVTVCHPVWRLERGGLEKQLLAAVAGLSRARFHHVIVTGDEMGELDALIPDGATTVRRLSAANSNDLSSLLADVLATHRVDVLHVRGFSMLLDALKAVELVGNVRLAMSFHGFETYPPRMGRLRRRVYSGALQRCDACWAVSRAAADMICDLLDLNRSRFDVVTNGVDLDRFVPCDDPQRAKLSLGLLTDRPVILCVGNLKPIKGHDMLLASVERLAALGRAFSLVCVGRDFCDGALHRRAAAISGQVQISFVGPRDNVFPWLSAADIYVQPSTWEGMSNSLLEAMACGLPIVATSAGGTTDVLEHGVTGLLAPPADADSLADALDLLIADPKLRARLGRTARERACTDFSLSASHARLAAQYERLAIRRGFTPQ